MNAKLKELLEWIEVVKNFSFDLLDNRKMYQRYIEIINANPEIRNPFDYHRWTLRNYGDAVAMRIRSQLDPKGITLMGLLHQLKNNPTAISRTWHSTLYTPLHLADGLDINFAGADFNKFAGKGEYFDKSIAEKDIESLHELGKNIELYVNKRLAHYVVKAKINDVTYADLDKFIDEYENIAKRYICLLTGAGFDQLSSIAQYDQELIFTKPWIKKE
ncbi:MAG TPA: hypothetical protein VMR41_06475 [Patescibacteria group bacterium]|nr:hypothetical protein [Patescibacteria group bacterium]